MARYQIDYTITRIDDDGLGDEIGFGGTGAWKSLKEAAYEVESQLANDEWTRKGGDTDD